ncbi:MAG TPA: VOC family protein [Polyangia bacterium]|jgi:predicted enzyme related to lactoylglutathione lyase|nr:VOC family protein [Polyangia bacterium]
MAAPDTPIVHIEFASSDFARTAAFYGELFGWQTQQNANASYMKFDGADGPSGGWVRADMVQSPGPIPYLPVADLAATIDKVESAGGRIIARRMPFAGGGEVALVADPDGNVLGLWMRKKVDGKAEGKPAPKAEAPKAAAKPAPKAAQRKPAKPAKRK